MTPELNIFDPKATWVIDVLGLFFDMLSIGTSKHWQTSGQLQEINVCTLYTNMIQNAN